MKITYELIEELLKLFKCFYTVIIYIKDVNKLLKNHNNLKIVVYCIIFVLIFVFIVSLISEINSFQSYKTYRMQSNVNSCIFKGKYKYTRLSEFITPPATVIDAAPFLK